MNLKNEQSDQETSTLISQETSAPVTQKISSPVSQETSSPVSQETSAPVSQKISSPVSQETSAPVSQETSSPVSQETSAPVSQETSAPVSSSSRFCAKTEKERLAERIHKEDKKSKPLFYILQVTGFFVGAITVCAVFTLKYYLEAKSISFPAFWEEAQRLISAYMNYVLWISDIVMLVVSLIYYRKGLDKWKKVDCDEDNWDLADRLLERGLCWSNVLNVSNLVLFCMIFYMADTQNLVKMIISLLVVVLTICLNFVLQKKYINLIKELYPTQKGSIYDTKFEQKWYKSSDEAQRKLIGIATYKVFTKMQFVLMVMILAFALLGTTFEIGILPILIPGAIWLYMVIMYQIEVGKVQKSMIE